MSWWLPRRKNMIYVFAQFKKRNPKICFHFFWKVIIFGREQPDEPLPPAVDALLRIYQQTINDDSLDVGSDSVIVRRILAPSEQAASVIGEHGVMINSIMEASQTDIRVLGNLIWCNLSAQFLTTIICFCSVLVYRLLHWRNWNMSNLPGSNRFCVLLKYS